MFDLYKNEPECTAQRIAIEKMQLAKEASKQNVTLNYDIVSSISLTRNIIYTIIEPFVSPFFYWTILLLVLHKFNFKKPVLKIILAHYILRIIGDIFDSFGLYIKSYDYYGVNKDTGLIECVISQVNDAQGHPLRWLLTRQIAGLFWYSGEIAGDWYPLLRTRAVAREQKSIWYVYITCFFFNVSKVVMALFHFTINGKDVVDKDKQESFYAVYWVLYLIILICSMLYDFSVFWVLRRHIFSKSNSNFGFLKKFRSISEFRILISTFIGIIGIPIIGCSAILKIKLKGYDTSLEDLRILIVNISYYMMFIDQIMLFRSKDDSSVGDSSLSTTNNNTSTFNNNLQIKPYNMDSKVYFSNLNNMNSSNSQTTLVQYSQHNNNGLGYGRIKNNNSKPTTLMARNNSITNNYTNNNFDDYSSTTNIPEWNYLRN